MSEEKSILEIFPEAKNLDPIQFLFKRELSKLYGWYLEYTGNNEDRATAYMHEQLKKMGA